MSVWARLKREILSIFSGVREGLTEVAERVSKKVHIEKLQWEKTALEKRIAKASITLGQKICECFPFPTDGPLREDIINVVEEIRTLHHRHRFLDTQIAEKRDDALTERLEELRTALSLNEAIILPLSLHSPSPLIGQSITALSLPPGFILVCLLRKSRLYLPAQHITLREGDRLLLLGFEKDRDKVLSPKSVDNL